MTAVLQTSLREVSWSASPDTRRWDSATPHVLVCIAGSQDDLRLIRHGSLLAQHLRGRLTVLFVLSPLSASRPADTLEADWVFAYSVGAPFVEVAAASVADGITEYALNQDVTHIAVSEEGRTPWDGSLVDDLADRLEDVEIYVLDGSYLAAHG